MPLVEPRTQLQAWGLALLIGGALAFGCDNDEADRQSNPRVDSLSHWLTSCEPGDDIPGEPTCLCGLWTIACDTNDDCGELGGSGQCVPPSCDEEDLPPKVCVEPCSAMSCPHDPSLTCADGLCLSSPEDEPPLGDGGASMMPDPEPFDDTIPAVGVQQVAVGGGTTCVRDDQGRVKCWGMNSHGQLGLGDLEDRGDTPDETLDTIPFVDLGTGAVATHVVTSTVNTCVVLEPGDVKCWGANDYGQLGQGNLAALGGDPMDMGDALPTVNLGAFTAVDVQLGQYHACALSDAGEVKCWGANDSGQLGTGDLESLGDGMMEMGANLSPIDLGTGRTAVQIRVGVATNCALLDDNSVKCWGRNTFGVAGPDLTNQGDEANEMGDDLGTINLGMGGEEIIELTVGEVHACVLGAAGTVKCWGGNAFGHLGLGDADNRGDEGGELGSSLRAVRLGDAPRAKEIVAGSGTCIRSVDGSVRCWGEGTFGMNGLGDAEHIGDGPGEMGNNLVPLDLGGLRVLQLSHIGHACGLMENSSLRCWGANGFGALATGDTDHRGDDPNEMGDALPELLPLQ